MLRNIKKDRKTRFESIKAKVLEHLEKLEEEENKTLKKAFMFALLGKGGKGLPVGTIREWKGKKFIKIASGKWRPKYDSHTKGAKLAISALKKKIVACKDEHEMMQLILENRDRFSDSDGNPLPFVQELYEFTKKKQNKEENKQQTDTKKEEQGEKVENNEDKTTNDDYPEKDYPEYKGKGQEAVDFIVKNKGGQVRGAFHRKEIGDIDVVWGEVTDKEKHTGYGLAHIIDKHGMDAVAKIGDVVKSGKIEKNSANNQMFIEKDNYHLGLRQQWNGNKKIWIVTGFEKDKSTAKTFDAGGHNPEATLSETLEEGGYTKTSYSSNNYTEETLSETSSPTISQSDKKSSSGLDAIREKYNASKHVEGDEDEIYIGDETIKGKWKLVEAEAPSASHDEMTFQKTDGFPTNEDGTTINDRDYEHDKTAQMTVISVAGKYDGRALSFDSPVEVTKDGVVVSGNERTMSRKLASKKGTDTAYIEALKKRANKFGLNIKDIESFKHPRVVFEIENTGDYSTKEFSKFNETQTKTMNPIEEAVKVSKIMKIDTVKEISTTISDFETMGEVYANKKAVLNIFDTLQKDGVINEFNRGQYEMEGGVITGAGKEFLETVLIGSVINEQNIRGLNREGCKSIRQKLVRAIAPLVNNKSMGGYAITDELNDAINIMMEVNTSDGKIANVEEWSKQGNMFDDKDHSVAVALAKRLEGTQKDFSNFMQEMNASLAPASEGQVDIFFGTVESKDDILKRILQLKKSLSTIFSKTLTALQSFYKDNLKEYTVKSFNDSKVQKGENSGVIQSGNINTIAIDFDGVINSFKSGWKGAEFTDEPVNGAFEAINILLSEGYKVVIYSTRAETVEGKNTIYNYLLKNNINISEIEVTDKKPIALVYIDDRAINFSGNWNETLDKIKDFKTWIENL